MLLLPKLVSTFRRAKGWVEPRRAGFAARSWAQASGTGTGSHVLGRASSHHPLLPWWDSLWSRPRLAGAEAVVGGGRHLTCPEAQEISQITSGQQLSPPTQSGCRPVCLLPPCLPLWGCQHGSALFAELGWSLGPQDSMASLSMSFSTHTYTHFSLLVPILEMAPPFIHSNPGVICEFSFPSPSTYSL